MLYKILCNKLIGFGSLKRKYYCMWNEVRHYLVHPVLSLADWYFYCHSNGVYHLHSCLEAFFNVWEFSLSLSLSFIGYRHIGWKILLRIGIPFSLSCESSFSLFSRLNVPLILDIQQELIYRTTNTHTYIQINVYIYIYIYRYIDDR